MFQILRVIIHEKVGLMYEVYSAVRTMIVLGQILKVVSFCTVFFAKAVCFS